MLEWLPYDHIATRPDLVEARVLLVPPKLGATAVSLLPSQTGLEPSLKRIRPHRCPSPASSLELLVCLWTDQPAPALLQLASPCSHCAVTEIRTLVPAGPAYTREQCQAWSKFWPCAFKQPSLLPLQQHPEETLRYRDLMMSLQPTDTLIIHHELGVHIRTRDGDGPLDHSTMKALAEFSSSHTSTDQYYCQGAVVLLGAEPCIMCAMALVHSRVDRVYFRDTVPRGAFSKWKLHQQPLNYMYRLFQLS